MKRQKQSLSVIWEEILSSCKAHHDLTLGTSVWKWAVTEKKQDNTNVSVFSLSHFTIFLSESSTIILNSLMQVEMPAGVAPIGLFWKHSGRRSRTRAHAHIWLISSKLKHFVRGVHSRYTHASTRRLNLSLERDTYSELGYISPFSIYSLSNYILVSPKKWRRAASRQLPGKLHGCSGPNLKTEGMKCIHLFSNMLWVCLHVLSGGLLILIFSAQLNSRWIWRNRSRALVSQTFIYRSRSGFFSNCTEFLNLILIY